MDNNRVLNIRTEIYSLQAALSSNASEIGDWKLAKISEYQLSGLETPYDIQDLHRRRQEARDRINELQAELDAIYE